MKKVHVAVGVIKNANGHILITKRAAHQHQGNLWEFPGGKVEQDESVFEALVREFREEVNLIVHSAEPLLTVSHDYGDKQVLLDIWQSDNFSGEACGNENQPLAWVDPLELNNYSFPEANKAIVDKLVNG